jgi:hypothetical protein
MVRRWTISAALLAGCYQPSLEPTCSVSCSSGVCPSGMTCGSDGLCRSSASDNCSAINDARLADSDADTSRVCFGQGLLQDVCVTAPTEDHTFGNEMLVTTNCSLTVMQGPTTLCVIAYRTITFTGSLRVIGPNPVVFFGSTELAVMSGAEIDVSSKENDLIAGAGGATGLDCAPVNDLAGSDDPNMTGGGGGAGGSYRQHGGGGGGGFSVVGPVGGGSVGATVQTPLAVRGGCQGGSGGNGSLGGTGGLGGYGGGAIYLASNGIVRVNGRVNASGAGGKRALMTGGGGGGGSGGFIFLDAPAYDLMNGDLFAVGGSGASGGSPSTAGSPGLDASGPTTPGPTSAPTGAGAGGAGGDFATGRDGTTATNGGGGGGGGSSGHIGFVGQLPLGGEFAPQPTPL